MGSLDNDSVDVLRQKARILERENGRLSERVTELLRENLELRGMAPEIRELNLPGLVEQAKGKASTTTGPTSERRSSGNKPPPKQEKQTGHGPTEQPELKIEEERFTVDEADKACTVCGKTTEPWIGKDDVVEVVHREPARWIVKRCTLEKCRCPSGCSIVTADGPLKLIAGGRYTVDVALLSSLEKFVFHLPTERQVRQASLAGMRLTSQALWDQQWALAKLFSPLVAKIKGFILSQPWLGADLTPFLHIKKGGSSKHQVWQLACPSARYFEMLNTKSADEGRKVFELWREGTLVTRFAGTAVVDGAAELERIARELGFSIANCWSHGRRNVLKADSEAPGQVAQFIEIVGKLYAIERRVAGVDHEVPGGYRHKMDLDVLRTARNSESRAVIAELEAWMLAQKCIPGGKLKTGLEYVAGRWTNLTKFLDDPRLPLDNNITEAGFVGLAQGRRNYVGCRTERGMLVATTFYTVFESARVAGANPDKYLRYAAEALLHSNDPLLPHEWLKIKDDSS